MSSDFVKSVAKLQTAKLVVKPPAANYVTRLDIVRLPVRLIASYVMSLASAKHVLKPQIVRYVMKQVTVSRQTGTLLLIDCIT